MVLHALRRTWSLMSLQSRPYLHNLPSNCDAPKFKAHKAPLLTVCQQPSANSATIILILRTMLVRGGVIILGRCNDFLDAS